MTSRKLAVFMAAWGICGVCGLVHWAAAQSSPRPEAAITGSTHGLDISEPVPIGVDDDADYDSYAFMPIPCPPPVGPAGFETGIKEALISADSAVVAGAHRADTAPTRAQCVAGAKGYSSVAGEWRAYMFVRESDGSFSLYMTVGPPSFIMRSPLLHACSPPADDGPWELIAQAASAADLLAWVQSEDSGADAAVANRMFSGQEMCALWWVR